MGLKEDLEILAHELECDPGYNFKGLMTSDGDKFTNKLARLRAARHLCYLLRSQAGGADDETGWYIDDFETIEPTHWMPKPEPALPEL